MFMNKIIARICNKLKDSRADKESVRGSDILNKLRILRRLLLGVVVPVLILSTTYSSVFFMKGELLWGSVYGFIMMFSGWCVFRLYTCGWRDSNSDQ